MDAIRTVDAAPAPDSPPGQSRPLWELLSLALPQLLAAGAGCTDGLVNVLDCGGGSGRLAVALAVMGARVTVVDVSVDALGTLSRRAAEAGVSDRVIPVQGDAEALAEVLGDEVVRREASRGAQVPAEFGLVLAHDLLGSVGDRGAALGQLAGVTAAGGLLSVVITNPVSTVLARALAGDAAGALAVLGRGPDAAYYAEHLVADCERAGLAIESVVGLGVLSGLMSGHDPGSPDDSAALAELESATHHRSPYRDIASKVHLLARR